MLGITEKSRNGSRSALKTAGRWLSAYPEIPKLSETPEHNRSIDALKGLAIILVVLGHAITSNQPDYYLSVMRVTNFTAAFIYAFHMPLFAWVSGFVISGKRIRIGDKARRLLAPLVCWMVLYLLVDWAFRPGTSLKTELTKLVHEDFGLWYLWFLFTAYLCLIPATSLEKRRNWWGDAYLVLFSLAIIPLPLNTYGFFHLKNYFLFFAAGYLCRKHRGMIAGVNPRLRNVLLAAASLVFVLSFTLLFKRQFHYYLFSSIHDIIALPFQYMEHIWMAFWGIIAAYAFVKLVRDTRLGTWLCWFGLVTLEIYAAHDLMMRLAFGSGAVKILSAFAFGLFLPLALSFLLLRKSRVLSALFLGIRPVRHPAKVGTLPAQA